jgi:hypothetical protein
MVIIVCFGFYYIYQCCGSKCRSHHRTSRTNLTTSSTLTVSPPYSQVPTSVATQSVTFYAMLPPNVSPHYNVNTGSPATQHNIVTWSCYNLSAKFTQHILFTYSILLVQCYMLTILFESSRIWSASCNFIYCCYFHVLYCLIHCLIPPTNFFLSPFFFLSFYLYSFVLPIGEVLWQYMP